jgi:flagellar export protein FliJ
MKNGYRRFHYRMEPVLSIRRWDMDAAKAEEVRAGRVLNDRSEEARQLGESIATLEASLREAFQQGASIDMNWHQRFVAFLASRRQDFKEKLDELRTAQLVYDEMRLALSKAKKNLMVLEKHKEGKQEANVLEEVRQEQKRMDDLWLLRFGRTGRER